MSGIEGGDPLMSRAPKNGNMEDNQVDQVTTAIVLGSQDIGAVFDSHEPKSWLVGHNQITISLSWLAIIVSNPVVT